MAFYPYAASPLGWGVNAVGGAVGLGASLFNNFIGYPSGRLPYGNHGNNAHNFASGYNNGFNNGYAQGARNTAVTRPAVVGVPVPVATNPWGGYGAGLGGLGGLGGYGAGLGGLGGYGAGLGGLGGYGAPALLSPVGLGGYGGYGGW